MLKKYVVRLSSDERSTLTKLISVGKAAARAQTHARILLKAAPRRYPGSEGSAVIDADIVAALDVSLRTVERVREAWVTEGLEAALNRRPARAHRPRRLDGEQEAHLIAMTCSPPPAGRTNWTMRLLADGLVELKVVDAISPETVRQTLKKTRSSRG